MTNDADNFREMLSAYIDGELGESDARRLEQALQTDAALASELARLRKVVFMVRHMAREKVGEDFASRVMARAERANLVGGPAHARHRRVRPSFMMKWGALAAAVVLCVGVAALVYCVINPGTVPTAGRWAASDHKKDSRIAHGPVPLDDSGAMAKPGDRPSEEASRENLPYAGKSGTEGKSSELAVLENHKDYPANTDKPALADKDTGSDEVLYTTNMDEARKNVEQVLLCNGVGADAGANNAVQSQFYTGGRSSSQAANNIGKAAGNVEQVAGNVSKAAGNGTQVAGAVGQPSGAGNVGNTEFGNNAQVTTNTSGNNYYAYNGNFLAVQTNDKQVQYKVLANRSQVPQIRNQLSQLRGTNNFNADAADGNRLAINGQADVSKGGGQGRGGGGLRVTKAQDGKDASMNAAASRPCPAAKIGPAGPHGQEIAQAAPAAVPTGTPAGRQDRESARAQQNLAPTTQPAYAKEIAPPNGHAAKDDLVDAKAGEEKTSSPTQKAPEEGQERNSARQDKLKSQEPTGQQATPAQSQAKRELFENGKARVGQSADEAKKVSQGQGQGQGQGQAEQQAQTSESLEPLLITINVVTPDNQPNAAAQQPTTAASSPAATTQPAKSR